MATTFTVDLTVRFEADPQGTVGGVDPQAVLDALIDHVNQIAHVSGVQVHHD